MISVRLQGLTTVLWVSLVCSVSQTVVAQPKPAPIAAGQKANFASLMGEVDADLEKIEPSCTNCGTMMIEDTSNSAAESALAVASMEDDTTLEFVAERPDSISGGPDPVVSSLDEEMDGLDFELNTVDEPTKPGSKMLLRKTKVMLKVNPAKRTKFPPMDDPDACDPAKPFKKTQKGWRTLRISHSAKKKLGGKVVVSKPRTVKVCVRTPPAAPKTCPLSCGMGVCQQKYTGAKWAPECMCKPGFAFDGKTCSDIDECKSSAIKCAAGLTCTNKVGGFECACGTDKSPTATGCKVKKPAPCDGISCGEGVCKASPVGATCACDPQEVWVKGVCKSVGACTKATCGISPELTCIDTTKDSKIPAGDYRCDCPDGAVYQGTGKAGRCMDINECQIPTLVSFCQSVKMPCRNVDTVGVKPDAFGATCGKELIPPAPSPKAVWNPKTKQWQ